MAVVAARIDDVTVEKKDPTVYQVLRMHTAGGFFTAVSWVYRASWKGNANERKYFHRVLRVEPEAIMSTDGRRIHAYHCRQDLIPPGDWTVEQLTSTIAVLARKEDDERGIDWKRVLHIDEAPLRCFSLNLWLPRKTNLSAPYTYLVRALPEQLTLDLDYLEDLRGFEWEVQIYEKLAAVRFVNGAKEALVMAKMADWKPDFEEPSGRES